MQKKKLIVSFFVLIVASFLFLSSGCSNTTEPAKQGSEPAKTTAAPKEVTYNLGTEPETLDPAMGVGLPEATVQNQLFEGLVRYNEKKEITPAIAESWTISPDGKSFTFKLRDSKWSNGDPLTAADFEYAWKRLLSPELAAQYAYQLYYIKGAEAYNTGKGKVEDVAVKAVDAKTLQVELAAPTPYFLGLTSFANLFPVNKKVVDANKDWNTKPETLIGNGPWKLESWEHNQKLVAVKNPNYWDAANIKIDKITTTMVEDNNTALTMFDTDQIDVNEEVPVTEVKKLLDEKKALAFADPSCYYLDINTQKKPFSDVRVRRAFAMAIDRQVIVDKVTQAGQLPAFAFVPPGFPDATPTQDYRATGGDYFKEDLAEAKKLLAEAGYPDGKGFPEITYLYNTSDNHKKIAEAVQEMWNKNLNVKVKLANQEWKVFLKTRTSGNYDIARAGWSPDYLDPMTFMDISVTDGGNNDSHWSNKAYDKLITDAKAASDATIRMKNMHDAEKILMDEMAVAPIYFYVNINQYKPWVKNVFPGPFGNYQEFRWGDVQK